MNADECPYLMAFMMARQRSGAELLFSAAAALRDDPMMICLASSYPLSAKASEEISFLLKD